MRSGRSGEHEPGRVHPPTDTVWLIFWELTKARFTVTEKSWAKIGLSTWLTMTADEKPRTMSVGFYSTSCSGFAVS